jgi:YD repeat-containing protein
MNFLYFGTAQNSFSNSIKKSASFILALFLLLSSVSSAFAQEIDAVTLPVVGESDAQVLLIDTAPIVGVTDVPTEPAPVLPVADEPLTEEVVPVEEKPLEEQPIEEDPEMAAMEGISGPPEFIGKTSESSNSRVSSQVDDLTGSLVYEYPIIVPPGRNKMTPGLALTYNSANSVDDSVIGSGWDFNIPSIERINRKGTNNLYTENYFHSSFDGELISTSTGMYAAKVENGNYLKYQFSSSTWSVTDKLGTVYKFGNTAATRQDNAFNTAQVFKWMLEEVRDTNDNYISYEYYKDAGQIYPSKITYTGNGSTSGILEVNFVRESRSNASISYSTGFSVKSNYRISEIRTEINDVWARKYTLAYTTGDNGSGSLLNTIVESGQDDSSNIVTLPAVNFDYQTATTSWTYNSSLSVPIPFTMSTDIGSRMADINGDGLLDILCHNESTNGDTHCPKSDPKIYLNNGSGGWTDVSSTWLFPTDPSASPDKVAFVNSSYLDTGLRTIDLNGDGLTDLVKRNNPTSYVFMNTGSGWTYNASSSVPLPFSNGSTDTGVRIVDINGDGLVDILCHNERTSDSNCAKFDPKIYLNNGAGGWTDVSSTWLFPVMPNQSPDREVFLTYSSATGNSSDSGLRTIDLNGDGLTDLVRGNGATKYVFINTGSGWVYDASSTIPMPFLNGQTDTGIRMADINGDGLVDILCHNESTSDAYCPKSDPKIYLNNGSGGWTDVSSTWLFPVMPDQSPTREMFLSDTSTDLHLRVLDLSGDGLSDLARTNGDVANTNYVFVNSGNTLSNLLTKITYAQGGNTAITYKPTTLFKDGSSNLLNPEMPVMFDAVYQTINNDGLGSSEGNTYEYQGGDYYFNTPLDRKLAGFAKTTVTDSAGNITKTYYHQGNTSSTTLGEYDDHVSKIGKAYRFEEYDASGNLYNLTVDKVDKYTLGTDRSFIKVVRRTGLNYDGDSDHADTASEYTYDNTYGNLTEQTDWGKVTANTDGSFTDTGTDKSVETIAYVANTGNNVVGLPYQDTVVDQSANKVRESKIYYDTLSLGSVGDGNQTKIENWVTGSTYVNSQKAYNTTYGIVTSETDPRGKTSSYSYDVYNLYPATTTNPLSQTIRYTYDYSLGKPKQIIDQNNFIYQTVYDGLDRVKEEKVPDLSAPYTPVTKTAYTYTDTAGSVKVQRSDYLNATTSRDTYQYLDGLGRLTQERKEAENSGDFNVKDVFYNNRGLVLKESLPYTSSGSSKSSATSTASLYTNYTYDPVRRALTVATALGTTSSAYDDWKTTVTDAEGNIKQYYNDARKNLIQVDELNGTSTYTTNYEWNLNSKLTKITDALSNIRNFTYDGLGRRLTAEDLHASGDSYFGSWTYTYDNSGNMTQSVNPRSQTTNYTYDNINRVLTEDYTTDAGTETSYTYDSCTNGIGKLCSVSMLAGANSSSTYASNGNVASETKTINGTGYLTSYTYDRQGNILTITYPDSADSRYSFNGAGLLEKVERKENGGSYTNVISNFNYNPLDQIATQEYPNGQTTTNTFDSTKMYRLSNKQTSTNSYSTSTNNRPAITLSGAGFIKLNIGNTWTEPGYTATDTEDGTLTSSVTVTGSVNTAATGTYQLVYSVADSQGAQATRKIRTVQVYPLMSVRALVVAGGGGGGKTTTTGYGGGGGGAGGMKDQLGIGILAQSYTITVGAGGAGKTTNARGGSGGNSSFGSLLSTTGGGGGGGGSGVATGLNGGSGGGAGNNNGTTATGVSGQGNNGGSLGDGAGGGGAGAVGGNGSATSGGNGGTGSTSAITGTSVYYAGGGGGASNSVQGQGGNGGGGWGGTSGNGTPGGANTGGGVEVVLLQKIAVLEALES